MCAAVLGVHGTLDPFFVPRAIAVVGAGRRRGRIGAEIFHNLLTGGFPGDVFAVNPHGTTIDGITAWPTVAAIPWPVSSVSSVGKGPLPTRVEYAFTMPMTRLISVGGTPSPVQHPPTVGWLDVTYGYVPKSTSSSDP